MDGPGSESQFSQLVLEFQLEGLEVCRRGFVALLFRRESEAAQLVQIPCGRIAVAEGDVAADQGAGPRELIHFDRDVSRAGRRQFVLRRNFCRVGFRLRAWRRGFNRFFQAKTTEICAPVRLPHLDSTTRNLLPLPARNEWGEGRPVLRSSTATEDEGEGESIKLASSPQPSPPLGRRGRRPAPAGWLLYQDAPVAGKK